ncbi:hypothetical protein R3I93_012839 [Phoxinus phoxinus]|uniref:Uncharacterized protein n=1 Tax=Phoxinus phoxinus TaxID=58324 RepID=A0AAN9CT56_9TELE
MYLDCYVITVPVGVIVRCSSTFVLSVYTFKIYIFSLSTATGDGDKIMCYCPSFHVVQLMKQGSSPNEACHAVLADIQRRIGDDKCFEIGLISLNMKGEVGAASSVEFPYTFWNQGLDSVEELINQPKSLNV